MPSLTRIVLVLLLVATAALLSFLGPVDASAGAIITNGTVTLGVNDQGHLNVEGGPSFGGVGPTGLHFNATGNDATSPGCLCEGWGVAIATGSGSPFSGYANIAVDGVVNVALVSFTSTASTATSVVNINGISSAPALQVTHFYHPSVSPNLYQVDVTIRNISGGVLGDGPTALRYPRVMDWDIQPTANSEFVTINGLPATNVLFASDDGFETANPLTFVDGIPAGTPLDLAGCGFTTNFTDCGPADHGALFDLSFPALDDGEERILRIFYGAASTEPEADGARSDAGVGPFSYGQCDPLKEVTEPPLCDQTTGTPNTFIFGFAGVGETPPPPPPPPIVPAPSTILLLGAGLIGLVVARHLMK